MAKKWHPTKKYRPEKTGKRIPMELLAQVYAKTEASQIDAAVKEFSDRVIRETLQDRKDQAARTQLRAAWVNTLEDRPW